MVIFCVWILISIIFVTFSDAQFFLGPKKKFMCQCEGNKCYSNGVCKGNVKCKKGYFGYACQYSNAFNYKWSTIYEIADESYDTCVTKKTTLEIEFQYTKVRYLRLQVKDSGEYKSLQFVFKKGDKCEICDGRHVLPEKNVVEYYCRYPVEADRVIILNKNKIPICHVEISSGRNFALNAAKTAPASINKNYSAFGLTDGITDFKKESCYIGREGPYTFEIKINLAWPIPLSIVEIYDIPPDFNLVGSVKVKATSTGSTRILASGTIESNDHKVKRLILAEDVPNVQTVTLTPSSQFGACEIHLIGDCPTGKHGLTCHLDCPKGCKWCTTGGFCLDKSTITNPSNYYPNWFHEAECKTDSGPVPPFFLKTEMGLTLEAYGSVNGSLFREGDTITYNCSTSSDVPVSLTWSWSYDLQNPTIINGTVLSTPKKYWSVLMYKATRLDNWKLINCSSDNGETAVTIFTLVILPPTKPVIEGPDEVTSQTPYYWTCYSNEASYVPPYIFWRDVNRDFLEDGVSKFTLYGTIETITVFKVRTTLTMQLPATTKTYTLECIVLHTFLNTYWVEKSSYKNITILDSIETIRSKNGYNVIEWFVRPWFTVIIVIFIRLVSEMIVLPA